jgi:virginiamycin B lyase
MTIETARRTWVRSVAGVAVSALVLTGSACSTSAAGSARSARSAGPSSASSPSAAKTASHTCATDKITTYIPPKGVDTAFGITPGPGGTWYAHGGTINRISNGKLTQFPIPDAASASAGWLTWDGTSSSLWFSDRANGRIGTINGKGAVREYQIPDGPGGADGPGGIVVGPGTQVWFTEPVNNRIGMLDTTTRAVTMRRAPTAGGGPLGLTRGRDGNLWFTEREADKVARMNRNGSFTQWDLTPGALPNRIITGPDGAVWFTELHGNHIGRIDSAGHLTEIPLPGGPVGLAIGPDGHMYVALWSANQVGRLNDDGSLAKTWNVPHGALQVAASRDSVWATNAFDDSVTRVQLSC